MSFDLSKLAQLGHVQNLANRVHTALTAVSTNAADAIKNVTLDGSTLKFYTAKIPAEGATPAFTVDFPAEMVIDQAGTTFYTSFTFSTGAYPGATDPNLDGKPVLVLAVKATDAQGIVTTTYSFLNLYNLVDLYTVKTGNSRKILVINDKEIEIKISAAAGNIITAGDDGLYATTRVAGAVQGNVAVFDANGAPSDSGIASADILRDNDIASDTEANEMLEAIYPTA